jgi:hypothetical protein
VTAPAVEQRRFRRLPVRPGALELEVAGGGRWPVVDLSPEGVSVRGEWACGEAAVKLRSPGGAIPCLARPIRRDGATLGLRLAPARGSALAEVYHRLRFPALSRRGEVAPAVVHDLFDRSGYTALKSDVVPSREWLAAAWPATLTREAVYTAADGAVLGHIGVTRAYGRTWLGHEIATRRDHPEALACRRALYHHFATWPRLLDGEETMLVGYYNRARPWHRAMFEGFAAGADPARECLVLPLDRFVVAPAASDAAPGAGVAVTPMTPAEAGEVVALIAAEWPDLARRAFDLDAARLASPCLHPEYAAAGLARSRTVLVVRQAGRLAGAATCEATSGHLSLFNVLNCAQLFLAPEGPPAAGRALVAEVRAFFAARGVPSPLLAASPGRLAEDPAGGLRLAETMGTIVWTARGLRRYEDYIDRTLADYPLGARAPGSPTPPGDQPETKRRS